MLGFWCPGLGFLDPKGRTIGCLLHPAQNNGQDLRGPTGYQEKCARESCSQARAFAALPPQTRDRLAGLCCGMDSFAFSSSANPLMKLLAFGPVVAAAVHEHAPGNLEDLQGLAWLGSLKPHLGWLLGSMVHKHGSAILEMADAADRTQDVVKEMARRMGPPPPLDSGQYLHEMCDEWESRFWKAISGRNKARPIDLRTWREHAADLM